MEGKQSRTSFIDFTLLQSSSSSAAAAAAASFFSLPPCRQALLPLPNAAFPRNPFSSLLLSKLLLLLLHLPPFPPLSSFPLPNAPLSRLHRSRCLCRGPRISIEVSLRYRDARLCARACVHMSHTLTRLSLSHTHARNQLNHVTLGNELVTASAHRLQLATSVRHPTATKRRVSWCQKWCHTPELGRSCLRTCARRKPQAKSPPDVQRAALQGRVGV